jgi:hypothetical protein
MCLELMMLITSRQTKRHEEFMTEMTIMGALVMVLQRSQLSVYNFDPALSCDDGTS